LWVGECCPKFHQKISVLPQKGAQSAGTLPPKRSRSVGSPCQWVGEKFPKISQKIPELPQKGAQSVGTLPQRRSRSVVFKNSFLSGFSSCKNICTLHQMISSYLTSL
jgi:hypothetical protein